MIPRVATFLILILALPSCEEVGSNESDQMIDVGTHHLHTDVPDLVYDAIFSMVKDLRRR